MCKAAVLDDGSSRVDAARASAAACGERFVEVAVVGAGLQGLTVGAFLRREGIEDFVVVDENTEGGVGGTWRDHDYPNCGTDTEICTYYPSFLPRPKSASQFAKRDEILSYCREIARTHVGSKRFLFNTRLAACRFDGSVWRLEDAEGNHIVTSRFVLPCIFSISYKHPIYPKIANSDAFTGDAVHSSRISKSLERFQGKRVVIIGCGATTLQLAPALAACAASCTVLRRTMPYVTRRPDEPLPDSDAGYSFYRILYEIRNDFVTFFDGWRRLEVMLRAWYWLTNYLFRESPAEALPPFAQPVQCTRRCYDYCGFMDCVRQGRISLCDVSHNPVTSFEERALVLADGTVVEADIVVYATGYNIAAAGADVLFEVAGQPHSLSNRSPNVFLPLSGCPLYCVPPRVAEQSMPYFVRSYRSYVASGASGALIFYPNPPRFYKDDSILFSPGCRSGRYTQGRDPNKESTTYGADFADVWGVPVPRAFFRLYLWGQRPLHFPGARTKDVSPPVDAAAISFELVRQVIGWLHGCRPAPTDTYATPLGGTPLRYAIECLVWPALYLISGLVGAQYTH